MRRFPLRQELRRDADAPWRHERVRGGEARSLRGRARAFGTAAFAGSRIDVHPEPDAQTTETGMSGMAFADFSVDHRPVDGVVVGERVGLAEVSR